MVPLKTTSQVSDSSTLLQTMEYHGNESSLSILLGSITDEFTKLFVNLAHFGMWHIVGSLSMLDPRLF